MHSGPNIPVGIMLIMPNMPIMPNNHASYNNEKIKQ